ncbi:dienelactone hydrolase family protein [Pandoraea bronchicola]|uniref:Dipeptidyl aminopeptidase n=1 Tax=Pandoraea bronchicola TaxID=2508287 RepID=A0A5E5BWE6_9BURK|nr:CocE/NonD family hydrolase [Pandoraea bronchicola]VVE88660.1 dipeptidyl aminopeptidase [Pandoraea bronchicola]
MKRFAARSQHRAGWLFALLLAMPFSGISTAFAATDDAAVHATPTAAAADPAPEIVSVVVPGAGTFGGDVAMHTEVYKPSGNGPFPVLVFEHGRASDALVRAKMNQPILKGHVRYWLAKGFAIVAPVRVGYGSTGGPDRENSGASFDMQGRCTRRPDFEKLGKVTAEANLAAVNWVRAQPWANKERIVLEGRSVGGFTTVATAATNPPGVVGYINFSGGAGGMPERAPGHSCDPEQMKTVYGEFGKTTKIPGLWLYAHNDQYWGPDAPQQWFDAFAASGSPAQFVHTEDLPGHDGHLLLTYGGKMWSTSVDKFVKQLGF